MTILLTNRAHADLRQRADLAETRIRQRARRLSTGVSLQFVTISSLTLYNGLYYSGFLWTFSTTTGQWTQSNACYVTTPNSEVPNLNVRYPARVEGWYNNLPLMMCIVTDQCIGGSSSGFKQGNRSLCDMGYVLLGSNVSPLGDPFEWPVTVEYGELLVVFIGHGVTQGNVGVPTSPASVTFAGKMMTHVSYDYAVAGVNNTSLGLDCYTYIPTNTITGQIAVQPSTDVPLWMDGTAAAIQGLANYAIDVNIRNHAIGTVNVITPAFSLGNTTTAHPCEVAVAAIEATAVVGQYKCGGQNSFADGELADMVSARGQFDAFLIAVPRGTTIQPQTYPSPSVTGVTALGVCLSWY